MGATVAKGASIPAEGAAAQGTPIAQITTADAAQLTMADVATTGVPIYRFHGTALPVVEEDNPNMPRNNKDPAIETLFIEANFPQTSDDYSPANPCNVTGFFDLPTNIRRKLIRDY